MSVQIIRGNALDLPLADDSVDLVVTSPPYFGLRSYQDGGEHYDGQIGDEATPAEFVDALIAATREMVRVVKPSGSIWVNLGDKYNAYNGNRGEGTIQANNVRQAAPKGNGLDVKDVRPKSLLGIPWRYALRCIDDLGLILRAEVIWSKPNGLPESVQDRVRRSHEQWFHFTLSPRYYSAVDEIREEHAPQSIARTQRNRFAPDLTQEGVGSPNTLNPADACNPLGKLPGSVWTIPTEPLHVPDHVGVDHFAAFPTEWPRRIVQGWSPAGICTECGEGRRPTTERTPMVVTPSPRRAQLSDTSLYHQRTATAGTMTQAPSTTITGEACACPEPTAPAQPGVVLDPFGGTGTTALVANALGRHGISVDMSRDYCRLAQWRTSDPKQRAKAARREYKPPTVQIEGQLDLLGGLGA